MKSLHIQMFRPQRTKMVIEDPFVIKITKSRMLLNVEKNFLKLSSIFFILKTLFFNGANQAEATQLKSSRKTAKSLKKCETLR